MTALLLLGVVTLLVPSLRERAVPRVSAAARSSAGWINEKLEVPLEPLYTRWRRLNTKSELARIINQLALWRNRGLPAPMTTLEEFIVRRQASKTGRDPWGTSYEIEQRGDSVYVRSAAQDRVHGSEDDIVDGLEYRDRTVRRRRRPGR